jgi:hypothetical protein
MLVSNLATPIVVLMGIIVLTRYLNMGATSRNLRDKSDIKDELSQAHTELKNILETARNTSTNLTSEEHKNLLTDLQNRIKSEASTQILEELRLSYDKFTSRKERISSVEMQCIRTIERLREELFALGRRGNLNLVIGIITTIAGLFLLGSFVIGNSLLPINQTNPATLDIFLIEFIPRISLVLLIEVFAYFFLSLYKSSLSEIKYFQNEVTSIEFKFMALRLAAQSDATEHTTSVIDNLSKIERNFILNKDQTTVDLERAKIEQAEKSDLIGKLTEFLRNKKES